VNQAEAPLSAMAIAMRDSVTVSMSDEMIGSAAAGLGKGGRRVGVLGQDLE